VCIIPEQIRLAIAEQSWSGTLTQLPQRYGREPGTVLHRHNSACGLRNHEPTLWWDYGVSVRFSRTGRRRSVHLSPRDSRKRFAYVTARRLLCRHPRKSDTYSRLRAMLDCS